MALEFTKYQGKRTIRYFSLVHSCNRIFNFLSSIGDQGRETISNTDESTGYGTTDIRFRVNAIPTISDIISKEQKIPFQEYKGRRCNRFSAQIYNTNDLYSFLLNIGEEGRNIIDQPEDDTGFSPCDIRIRINSTTKTDDIINAYTLLEFGNH